VFHIVNFLFNLYLIYFTHVYFILLVFILLTSVLKDNMLEIFIFLFIYFVKTWA